MFPLGWGLSYTQFTYQSINAVQVSSLPPSPIRGGAALTAAAATIVVRINVSVCNTGLREGTEVVLAYVRDPRGSARPPQVTATSPMACPTCHLVLIRVQVAFWKRVVGFTRLSLSSGQCGDAVIDVSADDLTLHKAMDGARGADLALGAWPGNYTFSSRSRGVGVIL